MTLTVRAPAKINLHLGVAPVRDDGFHPLHTVYQAIGLYDDVTVSTAEEWSVSVEPAGAVDVSVVPLDEGNIAIRAGRLLAAHHGLERAARIEITKGIPVAGGMAGGSADAAATLLALDRLWELDTTDDDLLDLAARLGSDVPFALIGGTALGTGRGEQVRPIDDTGEWWWVVVPNADGLSTPRVYAEFDRLGLGRPLEAARDLSVALVAGDPERLAPALHNDLQQAALSLRPDLAETLTALTESGARAAIVSGSGPTCLGLADDADHARSIVQALERPGVTCAPGPVAGAHPVSWA